MSATEFSLIDEVFFALCKSVDSAFSLKAWLLWKYDKTAFLEIEFEPERYASVSLFKSNLLRGPDFASDYMISAYLSKYKGVDVKVDLKAAALERFTTSEETCRVTNRRFTLARSIGHPTIQSEILYLAKKKIERILGSFANNFSVLANGWGKGATSSIPRRQAFIDSKMCEFPVIVTRRSLPFVREVLRDDLHWASCILNVEPSNISGDFCWLPHCFQIVEACVIDTVPKNSKTDRVIAKEHALTGFLQKGFGVHIRRRLKSVGINLDNQGVNQHLASLAYDEGLSTLDLKNASDTVAKELVFELLPPTWARALDCVRSHVAKMPDGEEIHLEKFSSMGNGFTFELESLIFWALSSAVSERFGGNVVGVYGDDLICSRSVAHELVATLSYCGFSLNKQKSYIDGAFFESCGCHYFQGVDVTPIYQKDIPDELPELIRCANRLIRYAHSSCSFNALNTSIQGAWNRVIREAGYFFHRYQLPLGASGDDGFVCPADYFKRTPQSINMGLLCTVLARRQRQLTVDEGAMYAHQLRLNSQKKYYRFDSKGETPLLDNAGLIWRDVQPNRGDGPVWEDSVRWVIPTWEFGLAF